MLAGWKNIEAPKKSQYRIKVPTDARQREKETEKLRLRLRKRGEKGRREERVEIQQK